MTPGTIRGAADPAAPLADAAAVAGTPALAVIEAGIGAYLESQGYVREHPLLYVDERDDPHVYVRFEVSEDGLGFRDTAYVYSPGVARQLDEIFEAYGAYAPGEPRTPYTSETYMLGRPIHAHIQSLETCCRETSIEWSEEIAERNAAIHKLIQARPKKRLWRRCRIRRAAARRRRLRGGLPRFAAMPPADNGDWAPSFRRLPLNWGDEVSPGPAGWSNWSVAAADIETIAAQSRDTWRAYVEPRLIHASRDRAADIPLQTWLQSGLFQEKGHGMLGDEWRLYDRLFWYLKLEYETETYFEDLKYITSLENSCGSLYYEFVVFDIHLDKKIVSAFDRLPPAVQAAGAENPPSIADRLLSDPEVSASLALFRRQAAVYAHRIGVPPVSDWRSKVGQKARAMPDAAIVASIVREHVDAGDRPAESDTEREGKARLVRRAGNRSDKVAS